MQTISDSIKRSIRRQASDLILRRDLSRFGSISRVDAVIAELIRDGIILRIGSGVYAKARVLPTGAVVPRKSLWPLAKEALDKLGIEYEVHPTIRAYELGVSEQIPMRYVVRTVSRVSRKMSVGQLSLEYVSDFSKLGPAPVGSKR